MKFIIPLVCASLTLLFPARAFGQQASPERGDPPQAAISRVLPIEPAELIKLLPAPPRGWKISSSMATNQVTSWVVTIGHREYEFIPPTDQSPAPTGSKPMRTRVMLIDTGFDPSAAGSFAEFKPGRQGSAEKFLFSNHPAIRRQFGEIRDTLQLLINRRFILNIEAENQPKDAVLGWARLIPLDRFNIPAGAAMTSLPPSITIRTIDEVNPRNNHESTVAIEKPAP